MHEVVPFPEEEDGISDAVRWQQYRHVARVSIMFSFLFLSLHPSLSCFFSFSFLSPACFLPFRSHVSFSFPLLFFCSS